MSRDAIAAAAGVARAAGAAALDPGAAAHPAGLARRRRTVTIDGCRLECEWLGPGPEAAPTLVFLHDGLGCVATWRDVPAALAAATGCGALVYSRAGYGGSDARPAPWPVRFMHDEALAVLPRVLAACGVRDGFLVGHSDGASIALIYAGTAGAAAAAAAGGPGVPAPDSAGGPGESTGSGISLRGLVLEAPHVLVEPVCVASIAAMARRYADGDLARRMARNHGANADATFAAWVEVWLRPEFGAWNIAAALPGVRCPVLAMQGDADEYGTLAQLDAVAAGCGGGATTTRVLAACGHTPHHQQREAALGAMARFIKELR
jgi:pimeloyl-ACP methyl ester carboxylesterase